MRSLAPSLVYKTQLRNHALIRWTERVKMRSVIGTEPQPVFNQSMNQSAKQPTNQSQWRSNTQHIRLQDS
eukprot:CAMPEP_0174762444 /NCGR_PEP_ID=MMETSP1094-20130205/109781_1 /TAXON_ID=156173 /ORGANISM="Chrysochromulina brevifilum, Strain UTEX LB 985" /LENGTH=69 /DNA_ID=CAMNT_0015968397 /DNA_START=92 /DNA_END=301 /DNA_ORIENTATION=+